MKKLLLSGSALLLAACLLFFVSCKKDNPDSPDTATPVTTADENKEQSVNASDDAQVEAESDQALDDANNTLSGSAGFNKTEGADFIPCGATKAIDTLTKTITLTYDGTTKYGTAKCGLGNRTRSGVIKIQLISGTKWSDKGAAVKLTFTNYTVKRVSDGKTLKLNGTKTVTNVNGGTMVNLILFGTELKHSVHGSFKLTFDDGTERIWSVARLKTISKKDTIYQITIAGDTTYNLTPGVAVWGTNRKGDSFYTQISTPIQANSNCGWWRPTAGVKVHKGITRQLTVTFGVDASGNAAATGCPEKYKINWSNAKGESITAILNYQ